MVNVLDRQNSIFNRFIADLRDEKIQQDRMRFRRNLERAGEVMAYEISKTLAYQTSSVETPLGVAEMQLPVDQVVVATILRAGVPYHQGFLNYFDAADNAFVSAYRKYSKDGTFNIKVEYISCCELTGKTLILVDPMMATGASVVLTYKALLEKGGTPKHTHIASIVATPVVSIWGATHPYAGFYGFGQNTDDAVQLDMPCRPCSVYGNRPCIWRDYRCLANIPPTTVLERVSAVIERNTQNTTPQ